MLTRIDGLVEAEVSPGPLSIARIGIGVAAVWFALNTGLYLRAIGTAGKVRLPAIDGMPPPDSGAARLLLAIWVTAGIGLIAGVAPRVAAALVAGTATLLVLVDVQLLSNHLTLLIAVCVLLVCADHGNGRSLLPGTAKPAVRYWPVFLLQTQLTTMYAFTALSKLNTSFLSGEVVRQMRGVERLPEELATPLLVAVAVLAVATEGFLAVGLWIPRLRRAAMAVGLALHAAIVITLDSWLELLPFALLSLCLYPLFFRPPWQTPDSHGGTS